MRALATAARLADTRTHTLHAGLLAAVLCAATAAAAAAAGAGGSYAAHRPAILLLGDSLTEFGWGFHWQHPITDKGWVALLAEAYSRKVRT
jgi:uncharacterized membrane protein YdcZ (DUF606 family)